MKQTHTNEQRIQLGIGISPKAMARLQKLAEFNGVKITDIARRLVEDHAGFDPTRNPKEDSA